MRPPNSLRDRTRAQLAPWAVAMALFLGIAAALLAGGSQGPLASAQANGDGDPVVTVPELEPEPVLGGEDLPPAGPVEDPPAEPDVEEPSPVVEDPDPPSRRRIQIRSPSVEEPPPAWTSRTTARVPPSSPTSPRWSTRIRTRFPPSARCPEFRRSRR